VNRGAQAGRSQRQHKKQPMKHLVFAAALAAASFAATAPVSAQVGLSVNVGEPNFYGRIELGDAPAPRLVYRRPVVVEGEVGGRDPVYLHVRPGYERNWRSHCGEYNACGQPVLFVRDDWYRRRYVPHYRAHRDSYEHRDQHDDNGGDHH
jgi:hypothetical protein